MNKRAYIISTLEVSKTNNNHFSHMAIQLSSTDFSELERFAERVAHEEGKKILDLVIVDVTEQVIKLANNVKPSFLDRLLRRNK